MGKWPAMTHIIDVICELILGASLLTMILSIMYSCFMLAIGKDISPPPTIFIGLFGTFAAILLYGGAHLIVGGFPFR